MTARKKPAPKAKPDPYPAFEAFAERMRLRGATGVQVCFGEDSFGVSWPEPRDRTPAQGGLVHVESAFGDSDRKAGFQ